MTEIEKVKELYKQSWERKWKYYRYSSFHPFSICPFCKEAEERIISKYPLVFLNFCSINGKFCGEDCLIDKFICGSKDSLMMELSNATTNLKRKKIKKRIAKEIKKRSKNV